MIFIIATGSNISTYPFTPSTLNGKIEEPDILSMYFPACSVFTETYTLFDCRAHQSKAVRTFGYAIAKASEEGKTIIILVPDASMVDRRVRNQAVTLVLKQYQPTKLD